METFVCELGIFEVWKIKRDPEKHSITDKYPYALKYRGRIIDFGETIEVWQKVVERNPEWLQQKVKEIDRYLETPAGKWDIAQGKAYLKLDPIE